jgi:putative DNA primase/helicase
LAWNARGPFPKQKGAAMLFDPKEEAKKGVSAIYGPDALTIVTEDSCALIFTSQYKDRLRFDHTQGKWFIWDGKIWRKNNTCLAFQYAREVARRLAESEPSIKAKVIISKTGFAAGVEKFCRCDPVFAVTADYWDGNPYLLGTPIGTVNLRTGELHEPQPDDAISKSTTVAPAWKPDCPLFKQFLNETFSNDPLVIRFVQQFLGYSLTGDTCEQIFVFCHGDGGNGKNVLLDTVKAIFGDYAIQATMESLTAHKHAQHPTDIAMLAGSRLVTAAETERGRQWAERTIKELTGGGTISAHFMRQDNFEFVPQFKLFIIGNFKPRLVSVTEAMRRRLRLVPFLNKPQNPDTRLKEKLVAEHPGILRWLIDGCLDWQKNGFAECPAINAATEEYFAEEDLFGQWLDEECDLEPGNKWKTETSAKLFVAWKAYLTRMGQDVSPWNSTSFGIELAKHGAEKKSDGRSRAWIGIRLKPRMDYTGED